MAIIQVSLTRYFTTSLVPLGADLYGYSIKDIKQTVGASGGISFFEIIAFIFILAGTISAIWYLAPRVNVKRYLTLGLPVISLLVVVIGLQSFTGQPNFKSDFDNNLVINKSDHFWTASYKHFFPRLLMKLIFTRTAISMIMALRLKTNPLPLNIPKPRKALSFFT